MSAPATPEDYDDPGAGEGMCDCGKTLWNDCDCGAFFEEWICGMDRHGQCSMAGTEDCDFECPRMARERGLKASPGALAETFNTAWKAKFDLRETT